MAASTRRAIVLTHAPYEGPARLGELLVARGYALDIRELHVGAPVPDRLASGELLIVMGGPMGVGDIDRPELAFLRVELGLLAECVARDVPVLGICLGAQLLAHAAGAEVAPMSQGGVRHYEVGWAPVTLQPDGDGDPILGGLPIAPHVLHWHGDAFDLPAGARRLASTAICANQGFRLKQRLFGLQFHPEVAADTVEDFVRTDGDYIVTANGAGGADRIRRDTREHLAAAQAVGDRLLGNIIAALAS